MDNLCVIEWCKRKIKEASDNADLESFEAYTRLLEDWEIKQKNKK